MPKPRPLTPDQARRTLAHRFTRVADNLRQLATKFGIRPYRCYLVHELWPGRERGEGKPREVSRVELLPTPRVKSLDSVTFSVFHAGTIPAGSVQLSEISTSYTFDQLTGKMVPFAHEDHIPEPYDFFYELVEDGRGDDPPVRQKYRALSYPTRNAENVEWLVMLERVSEDRGRDGQSKYLTGQQ